MSSFILSPELSKWNDTWSWFSRKIILSGRPRSFQKNSPWISEKMWYTNIINSLILEEMRGNSIMQEIWRSVYLGTVYKLVFVIPSEAEESLFLEIMRKKLLNSHKMSLKEIPTGWQNQKNSICKQHLRYFYLYCFCPIWRNISCWLVFFW